MLRALLPPIKMTKASSSSASSCSFSFQKSNSLGDSLPFQGKKEGKKKSFSFPISNNSANCSNVTRAQSISSKHNKNNNNNNDDDNNGMGFQKAFPNRAISKSILLTSKPSSFRSTTTISTSRNASKRADRIFGISYKNISPQASFYPTNKFKNPQRHHHHHFASRISPILKHHPRFLSSPSSSSSSSSFSSSSSSPSFTSPSYRPRSLILLYTTTILIILALFSFSEFDLIVRAKAEQDVKRKIDLDYSPYSTEPSSNDATDSSNNHSQDPIDSAIMKYLSANAKSFLRRCHGNLHNSNNNNNNNNNSNSEIHAESISSANAASTLASTTSCTGFHPIIKEFHINTFDGNVKNEDRFIATSCALGSLFGIFDGHAGKDVAEFAMSNIASYLSKYQEGHGTPAPNSNQQKAAAEDDEDTRVRKIFEQAFVSMDNDLLDKFFKDPKSWSFHSGSCAIAALILNPSEKKSSISPASSSSSSSSSPTSSSSFSSSLSSTSYSSSLSSSSSFSSSSSSSSSPSSNSASASRPIDPSDVAKRIGKEVPDQQQVLDNNNDGSKNQVKLFVANLGDSRCIIGQRKTEAEEKRDNRSAEAAASAASKSASLSGRTPKSSGGAAGSNIDFDIAQQQQHLQWNVVALSHDHQLSNAEERQRIAKEHPGEIGLFESGRVKGILMPTRALGDGVLKQARFNRAANFFYKVSEPYNPPYVSNVPEVLVHAISDRDEFAVIASDGLWDLLSNQQVVELVGQWKDYHHRSNISNRQQLHHVAVSSSQSQNSSFLSKKSSLSPGDVESIDNASTFLIKKALEKVPSISASSVREKLQRVLSVGANKKKTMIIATTQSQPCFLNFSRIQIIQVDPTRRRYVHDDITVIVIFFSR